MNVFGSELRELMHVTHLGMLKHKMGMFEPPIRLKVGNDEPRENLEYLNEIVNYVANWL